MAHQISEAAAGPSTARPKQLRLTKEGSAFLTDFARSVTSYPQRAQKEALLNQLHAIPGNEAFTLEKLSNWFARHRHLPGSASEPHAVLLDDETILFPKFTPMQLQKLRCLYRARPNPSDSIITFWAGRIDAEEAEVLAWITYQHEKEKEHSIDTAPESPDIPLRRLVGDSTSGSPSASASPVVPGQPRPHLPTPSKSLSPSPQMRMPSLPPITVKVEDPLRCASPESFLVTPSWEPSVKASEQLPAQEAIPPRFQSVSTQQVNAPHAFILPPSAPLPASLSSKELSDANTFLVTSIRDSLRLAAIPGAEPPKSGDEFAAKFQYIHTMIDEFMKKYDTGELARLGWDSSLKNTTA